MEVTEEEFRVSQEKYEKLKSNMYAWQHRWAPRWRPSHLCTIASFAVLSLICLILGIVILGGGGLTQEVSVRFDDACENQPSCQVSFSVDEEMKGPVYAYYQLDGFYQNHRRYVKSYSKTQMLGKELTE